MKLVGLRTGDGAVAWWEHAGRRKPVTGYPGVDGVPVEAPDWGNDSPGAWALGYCALMMATHGQDDVASAWLGAFVFDVVANATGPRVEFTREWVREWMVEACCRAVEKGPAFGGWADTM